MSQIVNQNLNIEILKSCKEPITLNTDILINILPYCDINTLLKFLYKYKEIIDILNLQSVLSKLVINNNILSKGQAKKITSFADFVIEYYLRYDRLLLTNSKLSQLLWAIDDRIDSISDLYDEYLCESNLGKCDENGEKAIIFATLLCNDKKIQKFITKKIPFFKLCQRAFNGSKKIDRDYRCCNEGLLYYCAVLGGKFKCASILDNSLYISVIETSKIICSLNKKEYWQWLIDVKKVSKKIIINTALSSGNLELIMFCNSNIDNEENNKIINDKLDILLMLRSAAKGGDIGCFKYVESLVNKNIKINYSELFSIAIEYGNIDLCQYLLKYQPEIHQLRVLISIIENNKLQSLIYLVKLINMNDDGLQALLLMASIQFPKSNFCIKWLELQLGFKKIQLGLKKNTIFTTN
jgi:hypothetical protein